MPDKPFVDNSIFRPTKQRYENQVSDKEGDSREIYIQTRAISLLNLQANPKEMDRFDQYMQSNNKKEGIEF